MRNGHIHVVHGGSSEKVEGYSDNQPGRLSAPITCRDVSREAALREVPGFVQAICIEDREYNLIKQICTKCGEDMYVIWRWHGASFSRYFMDEDFSPSAFAEFAHSLDDSLGISSADLLAEYKEDLDKKNTAVAIYADFSYAFRLLEYGRHRISKLHKLGALETLLSREPTTTPTSEAVRAAFELGVAAAEHKIMNVFEDYMYAAWNWKNGGRLVCRRLVRSGCGRVRRRVRRYLKPHGSCVRGARNSFGTTQKWLDPSWL